MVGGSQARCRSTKDTCAQLLLPDLVLPNTPDRVGIVKRFQAVCSGAVSRDTFAMNLLELVAVSPAGALIEAANLVQVLNLLSKVRSSASAVAPPLSPAVLAALSEFTNSYDIGRAGRDAYMMELTTLAKHFNDFAEALMSEGCCECDNIADTYKYIDETMIHVMRLAEWSSTKTSDKKCLEVGS